MTAKFVSSAGESLSDIRVRQLVMHAYIHLARTQGRTGIPGTLWLRVAENQEVAFIPAWNEASE